MTCAAQDTITNSDMLGLKADITTIDVVVESQENTTETKNGVTINTLNGQLKLLGWQPPIAYAGGILFDTNDNTKVTERAGPTFFAPLPSELPFTTSGTWVADDEDKFHLILYSTATNTELNINGRTTNVETYLENSQVPDYATLIANSADYSDGDIVDVAYRDDSTKVPNSGGSFLISDENFVAQIALDTKKGLFIDLGGGLTAIRRGVTGKLNTRWFGLLSNGLLASAAINTAAIQGALDYAKPIVEGATYRTTVTASVYTQAGAYYANALTIWPGIKFIAEGLQLVVFKHAETGLVDFISTDVGTDSPNITIRGMRIEGNGATNTRYGLRLDKCFYNCIVDQVIIEGCEHGGWWTDCWTLTLKHSIIRGNTHGLYWFDANAARIVQTRIEYNTNYNAKIENAGSLYITNGIFQGAEADDSLILTECNGTVLDGCDFEDNNRNDGGFADLNAQGSVLSVDGGFWAQTNTPARSTGIAIKSNVANLSMDGVMVTPGAVYEKGLQLNFTGSWGQTDLSACQLGAGGLDDSNYAGHLNHDGLGYGASPDVRGNIPHFLAPQNRNGGIVIGNRNFQSLIGHADNRGTYDEEVLLITSPEHKTNNNNTDHTMMLDTRNLIAANITGITKGITTEFTHDGIAGEFKNGWIVIIEGIIDDGPGGDIESTFNSTSHTITVTGNDTFTVAANSSALVNNWASGGTTTRPAKQTVTVQGTWDKPFYMGPFALWPQANGTLRLKNGEPTSDTDGTVVGTQT